MPTTPKDRNLTQFKEPMVTDVDSGITAIHHTLGPEAFQSSPGSHRHDGSDSNRIKFSDVEGGYIDGGTPSSTYESYPPGSEPA
jgi:hypothetical protein